jgi:phosphoglycerate dehydrogenase-like enzyme
MKILFHGENAIAFRPGIESLLEGDHEIVTVGDDLAEPGAAAHFATAEIIVGVRLTPAMPRPGAVRLFHFPGAGADAIDRSCLPPGAVLCNCFGHEIAIAEFVMAALLARHVPLADADARLRRGDWRYWAGTPGSVRTELGAQTVGLLGFGRIGTAIAERARAFGMGVTAANRSPVPPGPLIDRAYGLGELHAFMGSADAIVASLPLTDQTRGLVDAAALGAMRPDAVIVNVGRGPVIDEQALYDALTARRIGGAIIDTWYRYPSAGDPNPLPSALPFHELDTIVMAPHMSGWTRGTIARRQKVIAANIDSVAAGRPPVNVVG